GSGAEDRVRVGTRAVSPSYSRSGLHGGVPLRGPPRPNRVVLEKRLEGRARGIRATRGRIWGRSDVDGLAQRDAEPTRRPRPADGHRVKAPRQPQKDCAVVAASRCDGEAIERVD